MIFVTGDTHGDIDKAKLGADEWPVGQTLSRDDYLIVCGDFGAIWYGDHRDEELLAWYEAQPWTTLFVDGNHENYDLIDTFPVTERFGGKVQVMPDTDHVIHLMRGEVYDLPVEAGETVRAFVMGGASSTDRMWRVEGRSWWAREMPSDAEYANATANLKRMGFQVDYVFTHDVPHEALLDTSVFDYAAGSDIRRGNELVGFLQWVDDELDKDRLKMWYAGHHHVDKFVMDGQHCVLYQQVVPLGEGPKW